MALAVGKEQALDLRASSWSHKPAHAAFEDPNCSCSELLIHVVVDWHCDVPRQKLGGHLNSGPT